MRLRTIFGLATIAASCINPSSAAGQAHLPSLRPQDVTTGRGKSPGARQEAAQAAQYTYGALLPPPAERQQAPGEPGRSHGLINPFFTRPPLLETPGAGNGMLMLPVLTSTPAALANLSLQSLYLPPPPAAESTLQTTTAPPNANSPTMQPAPTVVPAWLRSVMVPSGLPIVIAPTVLGYTKNVEPAFYGKAPEPVSSVPVFALLAPQPLALEQAKMEGLHLASLRPRDVEYTSAERADFPGLFRLSNRTIERQVIPWDVSTGHPAQTPEEAGTGFRLPRAIQSLVNVNLHVGLGIPSFHPNIGSMTQTNLGLSGVYNYLSPNVTDRLKGPHDQQSGQSYP